MRTALMLFLSVCLGVTATHSLAAQAAGTTKTGGLDDQGWHFTGKISDVNPGNRTVTILADSLPSTGSSVPGTIPYTVPKSVSIEQFHRGDRVSGEIVRSSTNLTKLVNVQVEKSTSEAAGAEPKDSAKKKVN